MEELVVLGIVALIVFIIFLDQISKWLIRANFNLGDSYPVIDNVFHITYSTNPGAAFGILAYRTSFFIIITIVLLVVISFVLWKLSPEFKLVKTALALQFGGAVGNLIDRVHSGYVTDFLDFRVWPIFNIADMAIVIGVGLLIYFIIFHPKKADHLFN